MKPLTRSILATVLLVALTTCDSESPAASDPRRLAQGTWGGDNAGLIVDATRAHVHVGCTYGDFPVPVELDSELRFSVAGQYLLRAYPIAVGPTLPAQFAGVLREETLTLTVAVNDTTLKRLVVLGPVALTYGREPKMGPCPICQVMVAR